MKETELEWLNEMNQDLHAQSIDPEELMNDDVGITEDICNTSEQFKMLEKLYVNWKVIVQSWMCLDSISLGMM